MYNFEERIEFRELTLTTYSDRKAKETAMLKIIDYIKNVTDQQYAKTSQFNGESGNLYVNHNMVGRLKILDVIIFKKSVNLTVN